MTPDPSVEIRGSGTSWAVMHAGRVLRDTHSYDHACVAALVEEARLRRARARPRPCLCFSGTMFSEGPHHRLCDGCRGQA